jgi:sugar phosphate isomerase/epimerase
MSWRLGFSTGACVERPILDVLPVLSAAGITGVELGTPPRHFDPWQGDQVETVGRALRDLSIEAVSIHAPFGATLDLADPNPHHRHAAIGAILIAASAIKRLGGRLIVVHPSDIVRHGHDVDARLADAARSLTLLAENCRHSGLTLVVESPLPHLIGGHPDEFRWLLGRLEPSVRVCLDTGHTTLGNGWRAFMNVAADRLAHVHANDNHGHWDDHLPPGDGRIDWAEVRASLEAIEFSGWIMLELHCPAADPGAYFARAMQRSMSLLPPEPKGIPADPLSGAR